MRSFHDGQWGEVLYPDDVDLSDERAELALGDPARGLVVSVYESPFGRELGFLVEVSLTNVGEWSTPPPSPTRSSCSPDGHQCSPSPSAAAWIGGCLPHRAAPLNGE
jgi:hypothetical protein